VEVLLQFQYAKCEVIDFPVGAVPRIEIDNGSGSALDLVKFSTSPS
jgi:hypothetical protein